MTNDGKFVLKHIPGESRIGVDYIKIETPKKVVDPTLDKFVLTLMENGRWSVNYKPSEQSSHVGISESKMNDYLSNPDNYMRRN